MITFNQLEIAYDKTSLDYNCEITDTESNPGMYICGIYLENYKNESEMSDHSDKAIVLFEDLDLEQKKTYYAESVDVARLMEQEGFGTTTFDGGLFYLIVCCSDGEKNIVEKGIAPDWQRVYAIGMNNIAKYVNCGSCDVPADLEHFILVYHALTIAMQTCDTTQIGRIWSRFMGLGAASVSGCNCNCR